MPNLNDELSCLVPKYGPTGGHDGSGIGKVVVVGALAASHRLRSALGFMSLLSLVAGLLIAASSGSNIALLFLVAGVVGLFWWVVACVLGFLGRIVGEDTGLIQRQPQYDRDPNDGWIQTPKGWRWDPSAAELER